MTNLKVNANLSALDVESDVQPYRMALSKNKIITFPNPADMPWDEAEEFMAQITSPDVSISDVFKGWLSEEDYQKLIDEKLTMAQVTKLAQNVSAHFESVFGTTPNA
ncbi:hypothetical protein ACFY5D_16655 [Paeniglutamicibacter sp. NPDC012692]|uniref:hypothetical protein n=1 Tax=Paeniglutamicibacter sp. NPDC012692 TaxID=3364388 RepID=UPI0036A4727D